LMKRVEGDLNEWLVPQFDESLKLIYDYDNIPALTERRKMIYTNVIEAVRDGIITRNEARERLDLEPIEGGDEIYINANMFPLGMDAPTEDKEMLDENDFEDVYGDEVFEKAISDIDFKPTSGMKSEAERGLEWRREHGRGGTEVGIARARDIANGKNLSPSTVKRMYSFFSRHEVDKQAEGFSQGEKGYPSNGRIAWALWGGDAGFSWSKKKRNQIENESKEEIRDDVFSTPQEAQERAKEIGCSGIHSHDEDGETIYMPCETHEEYEELTGDRVKMTVEDLHETAKQLLNGK
jgi:hypothetical protein